MKKSINALCLLLVTASSYAQINSNKSGDITSGDVVVAEVEKFGGSAEVRPKFRVINQKKDTLVMINFKKDLGFDWMQFQFRGRTDTIEVNTGEVISGLNYRKNLGAFLVKNNLVTDLGSLNDTALVSFASRYPENLTVKYQKLNEWNHKVQNTKFDHTLSDNGIHVNGHIVGYISVPQTGALEVTDIVYYDLNRAEVGKGFRDRMGNVTMKMNDGKTVKFAMATGNTADGGNKMNFVTGILRELYRNGYYQN